MNPESSLSYLRQIASKLSNSILRDCCLAILGDERFSALPASPMKHHPWPGGLVTHTAQVVQIALAHAEIARQHGKPLAEDVLIVAGIFHDSGKMEDYVLGKNGGPSTYTEHHALVGHVPRSFHNFVSLVDSFESVSGERLEPAISLAIQHCILSHHGLPEWGSAKMPITREAHCLHHADMLSVFAIEERKSP